MILEYDHAVASYGQAALDLVKALRAETASALGYGSTWATGEVHQQLLDVPNCRIARLMKSTDGYALAVLNHASNARPTRIFVSRNTPQKAYDLWLGVVQLMIRDMDVTSSALMPLIPWRWS